MTETIRHFRILLRRLFSLGFVVSCSLGGFVLQSLAGNFSGAARLEVSDPTAALSWNSTANALSVQCWFKFSIPSGTNLTDNMTILVNRRSGSQSDPHAYLIFFNIYTGNVEFSARGSGLYTNTLITRPYLDRWYHVAVVRQGESFTAYVDGRQVFSGSGSTGNSHHQFHRPLRNHRRPQMSNIRAVSSFHGRGIGQSTALIRPGSGHGHGFSKSAICQMKLESL